MRIGAVRSRWIIWITSARLYRALARARQTQIDIIQLVQFNMQTNDARLISCRWSQLHKIPIQWAVDFCIFRFTQESTVTISVRSPGEKRRKTLLLEEEEVMMAVKEKAHGFAFAWAYPFVHPSGGTNLALLQLHAGRAGTLCICIYMHIYVHTHTHTHVCMCTHIHETRYKN